MVDADVILTRSNAGAIKAIIEELERGRVVGVAKKTKDESGGSKEGGVDIAVMGNSGEMKAKGNQGGKSNKENLSDAVSKDPRGDASRLAVKPP